MSHAVDAALKGAVALAKGIAPLEALSEPGEALELARRLDQEAEALSRSAALLEALAIGLRVQATAAVDAAGEQALVDEPEAGC